MAVFVLVHGGFHGGWCWQRVTPHLRAAGHEVYTPTLTGLGERAHLATPETGVRGAPRRRPGGAQHGRDGGDRRGRARLRAAGAPGLLRRDRPTGRARDGESDLDCHEEIRGAARSAFEARAGRDGLLAPRLRAHLFGIASPEDSAWVNGKLTPHPIKAFTDPLRVTDAARFAGRRTFVYCSVGDVAVWASRMVARVRAEPGWRYRELATGHDAMITAPRELAELLLELV